MGKFNLKLNTPAPSLSISGPVPVCLDDSDNEIGVCTVDVSSRGVIGKFDLDQRIPDGYIPTFDTAQVKDKIPELVRIIFKDKSTIDQLDAE